ncbi:MAG: hypothetical protein CR986_03550 [Ignavibacteriae bacterium]|nr:MAG: hypothetical protein CR986_03550 [Ignavibacteriota bacterium]
MKYLTKIIYFILLLFFLVSCDDDKITNNKDELSGTYKATKFTEPGSTDGGVDILANNGSLTLQFNKEQKVEGHLLIPADIGSNFAPIDTDFNGNYKVTNDTLRFSNTVDVLDNNVYFLTKDSKLETPDYEGRRSLFKIILEKK